MAYVGGVHPAFDEKKAWEYLSKTNIDSKAKIKSFSKGMVVQIHLALVMVIDAKHRSLMDQPWAGRPARMSSICIFSTVRMILYAGSCLGKARSAALSMGRKYCSVSSR